MSEEMYTCEHCGRQFPQGWSTAEAEREAEEAWGVAHASANSAMVCICDDCFQAFEAWRTREGLFLREEVP